MMKVTKPAMNRIDVALSGRLDRAEIVEALDDLLKHSEGMTHARMLYTVQDFEMPSLGALSAEILRMPSVIGLVSRFDRIAVLSNTGWLRSAAEIEGAMIPHIALKSFPLSECEAAEDWLEGEPVEDADNYPV